MLRYSKNVDNGRGNHDEFISDVIVTSRMTYHHMLASYDNHNFYIPLITPLISVLYFMDEARHQNEARND